MKRPTAIDLFCGAGGLSLGFEQAGFDIVSAVEIDPVHAGVHSYNFPTCKVFCRDIEGISGKELMCSHNSIDVIIGGPPCQGFSLIGKRDMADRRNSLVMQFMRVVSKIMPRYFVMENVVGITIGDARKILDEAIKFIESFGYSIVKPYKVLNAHDYCVPQSRKRLFLIGYRNDQIVPEYPKTKNESYTVGDAIADLPDIDKFDSLLKSDCLEYKVDPQSKYALMLHNVDMDKSDFSIRRHWNPNVITGEMRTVHTEKSKQRFHDTVPGQVEPVSRFLKLSYDGVCNTLRAGTDKSRGAYTSPRPIHPRYDRCISVREAQRLHSFPDWFRVHSTKWHGFREVGNSVPPLLARSVGEQIISAMGITPTIPDIVLQFGNEAFLYANATDAARLLSGVEENA